MIKTVIILYSGVNRYENENNLVDLVWDGTSTSYDKKTTDFEHKK